MTLNDKQEILQLVSQALQENMGNKITVAVANGILYQVDSAAKTDAPVIPAKE